MSAKKFTLIPLLLWGILLLLFAFIVFKCFERQEQGAAKPQSLAGAAKIDDGDSLKIRRERVRLVGIDAPELHQFCQKDGEPYACGVEAAEHLRALINGRAVRCDWVERDKYQRILGHCFAGETDLNRSMVADGWAVAYSFASAHANNYKQLERAAKAAKIGLWQGRLEQPKKWRKEHPRRDARNIAQ